MWIVAIAWIYVVGLMAVTEPSIVAGVMTFVSYCAIPLSILFYLTGGRRRRTAREAAERTHGARSRAEVTSDGTGGGDRSHTSNRSSRNDKSDSDDADGGDGGGDGGGD